MPDVSQDIQPANPRIFAPSEEKAKEVLNALACGDYSFVDIAQNHDTTVEALSAWMETDEVAQRLAMIESGPARQARLVATIRMPDAVRALTAALDNLRFEEEHAVTDHRNQRIRELRRRGADTLRKIVALLHRITKFEPHSARPSRPPLTPSSPKGEVARSSEPEGATCSTCPTCSQPTNTTRSPLPVPDAQFPASSLNDLRAFLVTLQSQPDARSLENDSVPAPPVKRAADDFQMRQHLESDLIQRPSPVKRANETLGDRQRPPDMKVVVEVAADVAHARSEPAEIIDDPLQSPDPPDATAPP